MGRGLVEAGAGTWIQAGIRLFFLTRDAEWSCKGLSPCATHSVVMALSASPRSSSEKLVLRVVQCNEVL
jgi:hypothetical protein